VAGFDFFRSRPAGYAPRTPAGALKAIGAGLIPAEHFVYASTSVKPLDEEPYDLDSIERMLARRDLGIETSSQLKSILEKLIGTDDQETALFGAEGVNALEGRYVNTIEALKKTVAKADAGARGEPGGTSSAARRTALRELARQYFELATLHGRASSIRAFYLRAAFTAIRGAFAARVGARGKAQVSRDDLRLMVDILVALGLHDQAAHLLEQVRAKEDPLVLLLAARVAFHRGQYAAVAGFCRRIVPLARTLGPKDRRIVSFWAGVPVGASPQVTDQSPREATEGASRG
jgi:hypothetical protein